MAMSMPPTLSRRSRRPGEGPPEDRGCSVWPRCVSCPWRECIAELPAKEHASFVHALKLVTRYLAEPDRALG